MAPWLVQQRDPRSSGRHIPRCTSRAALSTAAMYGWFGSLTLIPLADATAISFTFPLFIALAGVLILKEPAHATR